MSRQVWEAVETEAGKVRIAKTKRRREERGKRKKEENDRSKKSGKEMGNLGQRKRSSKV